ncbi:MAG: hypothetical protein KDK07_05495 [Bauldia sp.]|nr:hypothetical protein [Bauldia sp.]
MLPQIELLLGSPVTFPFLPVTFYAQVALGGQIQPPTSSKITVISESGFKIVFKGDFTVAGSDVTGGTMTKFTVFAGTTKAMEGTGYEVDAAALFDALQVYGVDSQPFYDLIVNLPTKYKGSDLDDGIFGSEGADKLLGRAGNDTLVGAGGDDIIKGGSGDDLLLIFGGKAKLWGGADDDVFGFLLDPMQPPTSFARIKDFVPGEDLIGLTFPDSLLTPGFLDKAQFHKGTAASSAEQVVIYDKESGKIYIDVDGTGAEAQFGFAKVTPGTKLHANDFYVDFGVGMAL